MPKGVFIRTPEHNAAISRGKAGSTPWNKGLTGVQVVSNETRAKLSLARMGNQNAAGERNWSWKGGVTRDNVRLGVYVKRRRARRAGAEGSHTLQEWRDLVASTGNICVCCGQSGPLTQDHIVPLSKGGSDFISNIQPLCRSCNSRKRDRVQSYLGNS